MKKLALVLLALVAGGAFFLWREAPHRATGAEIAPPDALLFAHLPDLVRTARRWPATALAQLWREREVQAFAAGALARMPALLETQEALRRLERSGAREAFFAVTSTEGPAPGFVAGLRFTGSKSDVAALLSKPWAAWRQASPAGRTELLRRPHWEIETHTVEDRLLAGCFYEGWYFLANDLVRLELTLARCRDRSSAGIASTEGWKTATAPLPPDADALLVAEPERLPVLLGVLAPAAPHLPAPAPKSRPIAWAVKLDRSLLRDTLFLPGVPPAATPLTARTHVLLGAETLFYGAFLLPAPLEVPPPIAPLLTLLTSSPSLALAGETLSAADFTAAFGPECAVLLDWPPEAEAPAICFVLGIRDARRAAQVVETITGGTDDTETWLRQEEAGMALHRAPADPKTGAAPALAILADTIVLGANAAPVRATAARLLLGPGSSGDAPARAELANASGSATEAIARLDFRRLFERSYETFRPFLRMSLAFSPVTGSYLDPEKLPPAEAIARHLAPTLYTQTARPEGLLIEAAGTLSLSQTLAGIVATVGTSSLRALSERKEARTPELTRTPGKERIPARSATKGAETSTEASNVPEKSQIGASQR